MAHAMDLTDKIVVVTGASAGIGASACRAIAARGGVPVLAARRPDALDEVAAQCGARAYARVTDVTRRDDVNALCADVLARFGRIDVWVNNAGRGITRPASQVDDDDIDEMMRVNVKSALYGVQSVLPHFRARNAGQIIQVSSMLGRVPAAPARAAYAAAKAYLNSWTSSLRMELMQSSPGIVVTLVSPGVVATDFGNNARGGGMDSRAIPGAQDVEELGALIADVIATPRADVYSRPQYREQVAAYYAADDLGAFEARFTASRR